VVCFLGAFALAGVTCLGLGIYSSWQTFTLRLKAQPATGTVLGKSSGIERTGSGSDRRYTVDYQFQMHDGELVKNSGYVSASTWDRIKKGDPLLVYYRPANPRSNGLGRPWINWAAIIFFLVGCMFSGVGIIGTYVVVQDIVAQRKSGATRPQSRQLGGKRGKQRPATAHGSASQPSSSQSKPT
jgi:hypothetical protein